MTTQDKGREIQNKKDEFERLKVLLDGRREEYAVFGVTSEDQEKDQEIIQRMNELNSEILSLELEK